MSARQSLIYSCSCTSINLNGDIRMKRCATLIALMFTLISVSALACDGSGDKMKSDGKSGSQEKKT
ncbi:MAG TPA: hypothetical protein VMT94_04025 [Burkholderiales bacterium]|nr:hypothetical protein [Burkholderiales bacterium]